MISQGVGGALLIAAGGDTDTVDATVESIEFLDGTVSFGDLPGSPDLIASNVVVSDTSPTVGDTITVSYDISNIGDGTAIDTTAGIYLSTDNVITTSHTLLAEEVSTGSNASGSVDSESVLVSLAGVFAGAYFLGVIADYDDVETLESDETNNFNLTSIQLAAGTPFQVEVNGIARDLASYAPSQDFGTSTVSDVIRP